MDQYSTGYAEGWNDCIAFMMQYGNAPRPFIRGGMGMGGMQGGFAPMPQEQEKPKRKGKVSAYNRRLGKAIKDLTARHKTKAGKWKKGWSQKRMMQAAHKAAKR